MWLCIIHEAQYQKAVYIRNNNYFSQSQIHTQSFNCRSSCFFFVALFVYLLLLSLARHYYYTTFINTELSNNIIPIINNSRVRSHIIKVVSVFVSIDILTDLQAIKINLHRRFGGWKTSLEKSMRGINLSFKYSHFDLLLRSWFNSTTTKNSKRVSWSWTWSWSQQSIVLIFCA